MVNSNNLAGHRERYAEMVKHHGEEKAGGHYVGHGDPATIGFYNLEMVSRYVSPRGATVVDVGCGIGRLARYLRDEGVKRYLGTDILPEILERAKKSAESPEFEFSLVDGMKIPMEDGAADVGCAFSVFTHLLDEQVFEYFVEFRRVLRTGGVALFSFIDFSLPQHRDMFLEFTRNPEARADVLKWFEKSTLEFFASANRFEVIEYIDAGSRLPAATGLTKLINGRSAPPTVTFGQSLMALRAI